MSLRRLWAVTKKEFKHLLRDVRMLSILLAFPAFLLVVFGYAVNFDVSNIRIAIYDQDRSEMSREFTRYILNSNYFTLVKTITSDKEIKRALDEKTVQCVMVIPKDLSREFFAKRRAPVQFLIDGVDGNTATIIQNYLNSAANDYNMRLVQAEIKKLGAKNYTPLEIRPVFWFNPELRSTIFFIPGLIGMILILIAVVSVSLSLVREKERNTIEQIDVSSINTGELLIGKSIPYLLLAFIDATIILATGYFVFGVEVKGSLLGFFGSSLVFLSAAISLGILASVISDSQQVVFMISTMISLLPSLLLSGFIFPIESMPVIIQVLTNITPTKFYIVIMRAIILRGVGIETYWTQLVYLGMFTVFFLSLASIIYWRQQKSK